MTAATAATAGRLDRLFRPSSLVLVGASEGSAWSQMIHGNIVASGFAGPVYAVNRRGADAHGRRGFASCRELPAGVDLAYVFVPAQGVMAALADVAAAGIRHVVLLSSGFAETGAQGAAEQERIADWARAAGIALLGPNSLGFNHYGARVAVSAFPVDDKAVAGGLSIISQSGATAHVIAQFARMQGIGLNCVVATGNEAVLGLVDVLDHFVDDPATRAIAIFAEAIKDPAGFRAVAARASAAGKPIVIVKVGRSALASQLAQAHTGAVTGDDAVFDAVCRQHGVIRMDSLEAMVIAAGLMAEVGEISGEIGLISISGGACELIADRAEAAGLRLAPFGPRTREALAAVLPDFGAVFNPLDVTGAAVRDPSLFCRMLQILADDPAMGFVAAVQDVPAAPGDTVNLPILSQIGAGLSGARVPGALINQALQPIGPFSRQVMADCAIPRALGGVDHAVLALAALQRWSARPRDVAVAVPVQADPGIRPTGEHAVLDWLAGQGVPVIPHRLVTSAEAARAAWLALDGAGEGDGHRAVLKIASPDIAHKSDIGGVALNLADGDAVAAAFGAVMAAARAHCPQARIDGCLVAPMRAAGLELFVGTARTASGMVLAVGLGGVWIEVLADTALRLLPVTPAEVEAMLGELRGSALLAGYRGAAAADMPALARTIAAIGDAALALGPALVSLEINPLKVDGSRIEALDALAVWDA